MAHYVLWIDSNNAHIFEFKGFGVKKTHLERKEINHYTYHPTENQIVALGRKFFTTYNVFNNPVRADG